MGWDYGAHGRILRDLYFYRPESLPMLKATADRHKILKCPECDRAFHKPYGIESHLRNVHKKTISKSSPRQTAAAAAKTSVPSTHKKSPIPRTARDAFQNAVAVRQNLHRMRTRGSAAAALPLINEEEEKEDTDGPLISSDDERELPKSSSNPPDTPAHTLVITISDESDVISDDEPEPKSSSEDTAHHSYMSGVSASAIVKTERNNAENRYYRPFYNGGSRESEKKTDSNIPRVPKPNNIRMKRKQLTEVPFVKSDSEANSDDNSDAMSSTSTVISADAVTDDECGPRRTNVEAAFPEKLYISEVSSSMTVKAKLIDGTSGESKMDSNIINVPKISKSKRTKRKQLTKVAFVSSDTEDNSDDDARSTASTVISEDALTEDEPEIKSSKEETFNSVNSAPPVSSALANANAKANVSVWTDDVRSSNLLKAPRIVAKGKKRMRNRKPLPKSAFMSPDMGYEEAEPLTPRPMKARKEVDEKRKLQEMDINAECDQNSTPKRTILTKRQTKIQDFFQRPPKLSRVDECVQAPKSRTQFLDQPPKWNRFNADQTPKMRKKTQEEKLPRMTGQFCYR
jgi:hypothetical protein